MEEKKMIQAKKVFNTVCKMLNNEDWKYEKDEEKLLVDFSARGEDIPMQVRIAVDAQRELAILISQIPFSAPEDKRVEVAIAVNAINDMLVDGSFDYNIQNGNIFFRMTNSFIDCELDEEVFRYMIYISCRIIDEYNDKLLLLIKGMTTIEQFIKSI